MRRLYFLVDDVEMTEQVSDTLHRAGITDWNFHAISRDEAGLYRHHIHTATPYQQRDVVHTGARWALVAGVTGLVVSAVLKSFQPLPFSIDWVMVALFALICGCFGAWVGGMVGLSRENYKLAPFHEHLVAGKTLVLVDVPPAQVAETRRLMHERFPNVAFLAADSTFINPLEHPRAMYKPATH